MIPPLEVSWVHLPSSQMIEQISQGSNSNLSVIGVAGQLLKERRHLFGRLRPEFRRNLEWVWYRRENCIGSGIPIDQLFKEFGIGRAPSR